MATKVKENEEADNERDGATDGPLLDLSDDAVKKMIKAAKKRGYVTMDELNSVLPSEEVTSEQIEDTMAMLSDMGINVIEDEDVDEAQSGEDDAEDEGESEGGELAPTAQVDYLSGLMIGHELAALAIVQRRRRNSVHLPSIILIGNAQLCARYGRALDACGFARVTLAEQATERGLWQLALAAGLLDSSSR